MLGIGNATARAAGVGRTLPSLGDVWQAPTREQTGMDGDEVAIAEGAERVSEGAEWAWGVLRGTGCRGRRVSGWAGRWGRRKGATTALPGRRRTRVRAAPMPPSLVRHRSAGRADPGRLGGLAHVVENPPHWGGLRDEGDDAHSVRYRLDCCRSCSQGQRPFRVDCGPSRTVSHGAAMRREWPVARWVNVRSA